MAPLSGVVFLLLLVIGAVLIAGFEFLPEPDEAVSFYVDDSTRISAGGYIYGLSVFFLVWFLGSLTTRLRAAEGGPGRLSTIAFGGGLVAAAMVILTAAVTQAATARAGSDSGIGADAATLAYDVAAVSMGNGFPIAMAVTIYATAVIAFRTGLLPKWTAWVSGAIAIGLLTPVIHFVVALVLPWILYLSIWLYVDGRRQY
jgi:hypothetical protein